jgi:hypothetical protein
MSQDLGEHKENNLDLGLPAPPRVVRRRRGSGWLLGRVPLLVWLPVLVGVVLLVLALYVVGSWWIVALFGARVPGKVTGLLPPSRGLADGHRVQFSYYVGNEEYQAETTVARTAFDRLHMGDDVKVQVLRALPKQPRLVEPAGQAGGYGGLLLFLALVWNGAAGFVLWTCIRKSLLQRRLVRDGLATAGSVVAQEKSSGGRSSWRVRFTYRAPCHGLSPGAGGLADVPDREWQVLMMVRRSDFDGVQVGTAVTVLYDARRPSRSLIYAFSEYEAVYS